MHLRSGGIKRDHPAMPDHDPDFHSFALTADAGAFHQRLVARHEDVVPIHF